MKGAIGWLVLAALVYFGLRTEAPTPARPWQIYATNSGTGIFARKQSTSNQHGQTN